MNNNYTIYCHTTPDGRRYIGQTKYEKLEDRWSNGKGYKNQTFFFDAIIKYGWDNIKHEIFETGLTQIEADEKEEYYIKFYNTIDLEFGYNIKLGGNTSSCAESIKLKISRTVKHQFASGERHVWVEGHGELVSGENNPFYGKHHSEESKQRIRENQPHNQILCVETNMIYDGLREAERQTGIPRGVISKCCRGLAKTSGGYHWQFYKEEVTA